MRWVGRLAVWGALAAGCAGAGPNPDGEEILVGNLGIRDARLAALPPGAPVLRIRREADGYTCLDCVLDRTAAWVLPSDESAPRRLRFQQTWLAAAAGALRVADTEIVLAVGETAVLRRDGTVAREAAR